MKAIVKQIFTLSLLVAILPAAYAQQYTELDLSVQPLANKLCITCHGASGVGNPVVGGPALAGIEPWYLENQLLSFRNGWRGAEPDYIPAHAMQVAVAQLSDAQIAELLESVADWPVVDNPASISGDASRGSGLYTSCAGCHGVSGDGNQALAAPGLTRKDDWYLLRQLRLFKSGYRGGHPDDALGAQMRASMNVLETEQDMRDVLVYINSLGS
mgnify:CR=1 FL=1